MGLLRRSPARRLPRTVLFTDIVGSTEMAAELGDRGWRRTVVKHHALIRRELKRYGGREIDTAGDGFFALFESPTDAVKCASAIIAAVHGIGLRIRAGLHTGEVETSGEKAGGIAVHIAARLLGLAGPDEVLVSGTVRDLVVGSSHEFADRGQHELKGLPGSWHAFALVLPPLGATVTGMVAYLEQPTITRRTVAIGAIVAGLAMLIGGTALVWLLLRPPAPVSGAGAVVAYGRGSDRPLAGWVAGRGPTSIAAVGEILWVANIDSGTVTRVDKRSGSVVAIGHVGAHPADVHVIGEQLWVTDPYSDRVSVLSAEDGTPLVSPLDLHASAVTGVGRNAWLADDLRDRLIRVDTQTFARGEEIALPGPAGPASLAMVDGTIWMAAPRAGGIIRVDAPGADPVLEPLDIGPVTVVAVNGDRLWAGSRSTDTVARIETDGRIAARADVCDAPVAIAPFAGGAWVACATERALWRLDESGAMQETISLDGVPTDLLAIDDRIWITLRGD